MCSVQGLVASYNWAFSCFPTMHIFLLISSKNYLCFWISGFSFFGSLLPDNIICRTQIKKNQKHIHGSCWKPEMVPCQNQDTVSRSWSSFCSLHLRKTFICGVHWIQHVSFGSHVFVLNLEWSKSMGRPSKSKFATNFHDILYKIFEAWPFSSNGLPD